MDWHGDRWTGYDASLTGTGARYGARWTGHKASWSGHEVSYTSVAKGMTLATEHATHCGRDYAKEE